MKDCGIVKDLLPLVAEHMASEESTAFVKEHLETCADCKAAFDAMKAPVGTEPAAPLKTVRKAVKRRGLLIAGLIACLVAALIFGVFARLTKPIPIHTTDDAFASIKIMPEISAQSENADLVLYITHNEAIHVRIERIHPEQYRSDFQHWLENFIPGEKIVVTPGNHEISVYAYTTLWDQMFSQHDTVAGFGILLSSDVDAVFFEPYNNTDRETLYQREGYAPEAGFALPRLVMNYYFAIALIAAAALFIPWLVLLFCKKRRARRIVGALLLIPAAFALAFLTAGFPATTIAPVRELAFVLVIALLLIGAGLFGRALLRKD